MLIRKSDENRRQSEDADVENETETVNELSDQTPFLPAEREKRRKNACTMRFICHYIKTGSKISHPISKSKRRRKDSLCIYAKY